MPNRLKIHSIPVRGLGGGAMKGGENVFTASLKNLKTIQQQNDRARWVRELATAQEDLKLAQRLLGETKDRWEFDSIKQDINELEWKIQQLRNQINDRTIMSAVQRFDAEATQTVIADFNTEVAVANENYVEILQEIKRAAEQLNSQLAEKLPLLTEIEKKASAANGLSMYLDEADAKQLKSFESQQIRTSNYQVITMSQYFSAIQQLLNEMEDA